jgi:hypothetical protein
MSQQHPFGNVIAVAENRPEIRDSGFAGNPAGSIPRPHSAHTRRAAKMFEFGGDHAALVSSSRMQSASSRASVSAKPLLSIEHVNAKSIIPFCRFRLSHIDHKLVVFSVVFRMTG